jgi:hypothetical protein
MPVLGKTGPHDEPDVSRAHYRNFHRLLLLGPSLRGGLNQSRSAELETVYRTICCPMLSIH